MWLMMNYEKVVGELVGQSKLLIAECKGEPRTCRGLSDGEMEDRERIAATRIRGAGWSGTIGKGPEGATVKPGMKMTEPYKGSRENLVNKMIHSEISMRTIK